MTPSPILRVGTAAAVLALVFAGASTGTARAADPDQVPLDVQPNGSRGALYLLTEADLDPNSESGAVATPDPTGNPKRTFDKDATVYASADYKSVLAPINAPPAYSVTNGVPQDDRKLAPDAPRWGVDLFYRTFLTKRDKASLEGGEATWSAYARQALINRNPTQEDPDQRDIAFDGLLMQDLSLPTLTLGPLANGRFCSEGGDFWLGIAFTGEDGNQVVGAIYRDVHIDKGTCTWTAGPIALGAPKADTALTLTAAPDKPTTAAPITLVATVTPADATGSVEFKDGARSRGTAPIIKGTATLTVPVMEAGKHAMTAVYLGDDKHKAASGAVEFSVTQVLPGDGTTTTPPAGSTTSASPSATAAPTTASSTTTAGGLNGPAGGSSSEESSSAADGDTTWSGGSADSESAAGDISDTGLAPAEHGTPLLNEFAIGGGLCLGGVHTETSPSLNPLGGTVMMRFAVRNDGSHIVNGSARFSATNAFGAQLAQPVDIPVVGLQPGEIRQMTATMGGVGQWGILHGHATFTTDLQIRGESIAPATNDTTVFAFPWAVAGVVVAGAAGVLAGLLRRSERTKA